MMRKIAVIDTETTWFQDVMSIGVVVADSNDYNYAYGNKSMRTQNMGSTI